MNRRAAQPADMHQPLARTATWVVPLLRLVFQLATVSQYGYFRDELLYLAAATPFACWGGRTWRSPP